MLIKELLSLNEATLGSRIEFDSYKSWKDALPKGYQIVKKDAVDVAQASSKHFEGVAGKFDTEG